MDRDGRWDRVERGYDAIVHGVGEQAASATAAIEAGYARGENDEFILPTVIAGVDGRVRTGDPIVHLQLPGGSGAPADPRPGRPGVRRLRPGGTRRDTRPRWPAGGDDDRIRGRAAGRGGLPARGGAVPRPGLLGGRLAPVPRGRDREVRPRDVLLQRRANRPYPARIESSFESPAVATYDLAPEMRAVGVTDALVAAITSDRYDFIVANFANPDMVGHTGMWAATILALEFVDGCLARIWRGSGRVDGDRGVPASLLKITADHGNADELKAADGSVLTAHSLNPVPIVFVGRAVQGRQLHDGVLADVAPTILELAGLPRWEGMTGRSLLEDPQTASIRRRTDRRNSSWIPLWPSVLIVTITLTFRDPAAIPRDRPVRHLRRRLGRLPQPPRRGAPALAVHDRAARPVRGLLARLLHLRPQSHCLLTPIGRALVDPSPSELAWTRTDSFVVGTLVVLLALIAGLPPAPRPSPRPPRVRGAHRGPRSGSSRGRIEIGVLGRPVSVSPLSARTQADRDLVALVFSGLVMTVRPAPLLPDPAPSRGRSTRPVRPGPSSFGPTPAGTTASRSPRRTSRSRSGPSRDLSTRLDGPGRGMTPPSRLWGDAR